MSRGPKLTPEEDAHVRSGYATTSRGWETQGYWQEAVCTPVARTPLAPREALGILTLVGALKRAGVDYRAITSALRDLAPNEDTP